MILKVSGQTQTIIAIICILCSLSWLLPSCSADTLTYQQVFRFYVNNGEQWEPHQLYLSTPRSLYDYYYGKTHATDDLMDFITPGVFNIFAMELWKICYDTPHADETFVNAVLMMVHQLSYRPSSATYPVETLVENRQEDS